MNQVLGQILIGVAWLGFGIVLFLLREQFYEGVLSSQRWGHRLLGEPGSGERVYRPFAMIVVAIVSLAACLAGIQSLYEALTGRDFPLPYARWSELWPF
jgi:hypothetical protein